MTQDRERWTNPALAVSRPATRTPERYFDVRGRAYERIYGVEWDASLALDAADLADPSLVIDMRIEGTTDGVAWHTLIEATGWHGGEINPRTGELVPPFAAYASSGDASLQTRLRYRASRPCSAVPEIHTGSEQRWVRDLHHSIAFDAASSGSASGTTVTVAHMTGSGSDRAMIVSVKCQNTSEPTGVTYDSVSLTQNGSQAFGWAADLKQTGWQLLAPSSGSNNIVATYASSITKSLTALTYEGVDSFGTAVGASSANGASSVTVDVSSGTDDLVVDALGQWNETPTVGAGQTERVRLLSGGFGGAMSDEPGASTVTMSWTYSGAQDSAAIIAVNLNAAGGGGGPAGRRALLGVGI